MKCIPVINPTGRGYVCAESTSEATHLTIHLPGPAGRLTLPVQLRGARAGTGNWTWNGSVEAPTLKPSVLHTGGHFTPGHEGRCWCDFNREHPNEARLFLCFRCHTWIGDGRAQFLEDCSHELKGQTLPLLDIECDCQNCRLRAQSP